MRLLIIALIALLLPAAAHADSFYEGRNLYTQGQFILAYPDLLPIAQQGNPEAEYMVGEMLLSGRGIPRDPAQALSWIQKAADQKNVDALMSMGSFYAHGDGVDKNLEDAFYYYSLAIVNGDEQQIVDARKQLKDVGSSLSIHQKESALERAMNASKDKIDRACDAHSAQLFIEIIPIVIFLVLNLVTSTITSYAAEIIFAIIFGLIGYHFLLGSGGSSHAGICFVLASLFWIVFAHRRQLGLKAKNQVNAASPDRKYASVRRRFLAHMIDWIPLFIFGYVGERILSNELGYHIIYLLFQFSYWGGFEGGPWQASPGKRLLDIYVGDKDGRPIQRLRAASRLLVMEMPIFLVSFITGTDTSKMVLSIAQQDSGVCQEFGYFIVLYYLYFILLYWLPMVFTREKCGVHDYLTKTRVYQRVSTITELERARLTQPESPKLDIESSIADLTRVAESGDPVSQYKLGKAYADGEGVKRNIGEAFRWFTIAANSGNANAQSTLARMYFMGEGTDRNNVEAYFWYSVAAKSGKPEEWADAVARYLMPGQIKAIEQRVAEWKPTKN